MREDGKSGGRKTRLTGGFSFSFEGLWGGIPAGIGWQSGGELVNGDGNSGEGERRNSVG